MTLRAILWLAVSTAEQAADDKASLDIQERDQRAVAASNGWRIVDVLSVPGHSRRYIDIHECAADMARQGIYAFQRLLEHLRACDFDVLLVRDGSRFARTQSLHSYVVESVISIGARIYSLADGMIDSNNYRMWISMGGYSAAGEIDRLKAYRAMGMRKNASQGLKTTHKVPRFWVETFDEKGKPNGMKPDRERYQRFFDDFVTVFCDQRQPYNRIGLALYHDFGHVDLKTGKPYDLAKMTKFLFRPQTWGHAAFNWTYVDKVNPYRYVDIAWMIGDEPPPPEVDFYPDVLEPIWDAYNAERVKAELRIRTGHLKGRASPRTKYMYSQLVACAVCHGSFSAHIIPSYTYYRCERRSTVNRDEFGNRSYLCENKKVIREEAITDYLRPLLSRLRETGAPLIPASDLQLTPAARMQSISKEIDNLRQQIARLALEMVRQPEEAAAVFQGEIDRASEQITILKRELQHLVTSNTAAISATASQAQSLDTLRTMTVDEFFAQPPRLVNQWLRSYLQGYRFAIRDGEVVGLLPPK